MNQTPLPIVILDANVLYPFYLRDFLLLLASRNLFIPKWSDKINQEWTENLLKKRVVLSKSKISQTVQDMNSYFETANVYGFSSLISDLLLPDPDDRHVLAAAIKAKATIITTANLRDFPKEYIRQFDIEILHPDEFITRLMLSKPDKCLAAFQAQVAKYVNPPESEEQILQALEKCELKNCLTILRKLLKEE